jgi:hypothetical protein
MMQQPCQLRFLFTRDTNTSHYTTLKIGRSEIGREKRVTPEFGEYQRRKNYTLQIQGVTNIVTAHAREPGCIPAQWTVLALLLAHGTPPMFSREVMLMNA